MADGAEHDRIDICQGLGDGIWEDLAGAEIALPSDVEVLVFEGQIESAGCGVEHLQCLGDYLRSCAVTGDDADAHCPNYLCWATAAANACTEPVTTSSATP